MPSSQLSSESLCPTAEAMRETSCALAIMSACSSRTTCMRPIPTREMLMSIMQKKTSTAIAVKFLR